jgi:hypothetical protein
VNKRDRGRLTWFPYPHAGGCYLRIQAEPGVGHRPAVTSRAARDLSQKTGQEKSKIEQGVRAKASEKDPKAEQQANPARSDAQAKA